MAVYFRTSNLKIININVYNNEIFLSINNYSSLF